MNIYIYYLYQDDMMHVRERVAYGEFTENENDWVSTERQKLLKLMQKV